MQVLDLLDLGDFTCILCLDWYENPREGLFAGARVQTTVGEAQSGATDWYA